MITAQKCAIVTGAVQGVSACLASRLLSAGFGVLLADTDAEAGSAVLGELNAPDFLAFRMTDPGSEEDVAEAIAEAANLFRRVDLLVVNAMLGTPVWASPEDLEVDQWDQGMRRTLTGAFLYAKHALPYLRKSRGSIVFVAPERVRKGDAGMEISAASRGGVLGLAETLAASAAPAVRVNTVSPGSVFRDRPSAFTANPHGAWHDRRGEDIANAVLHLAESKTVSGRNIDIEDL